MTSQMFDEWRDRGNQPEQSDRKALEWHIKAANQGEIYSLRKLGDDYETGRGCVGEMNQEKALEWRTKATECAQSDCKDQYYLANFYADPDRGGVLMDWEKAIEGYDTLSQDELRVTGVQSGVVSWESMSYLSRHSCLREYEVLNHEARQKRDKLMELEEEIADEEEKGVKVEGEEEEEGTEEERRARRMNRRRAQRLRELKEAGCSLWELEEEEEESEEEESEEEESGRGGRRGGQ